MRVCSVPAQVSIAVPEVYQKVRLVFEALFPFEPFPFPVSKLPTEFFFLQKGLYLSKASATNGRFRGSKFAKRLGSKDGWHIVANRATEYPSRLQKSLDFGSLCQKPLRFVRRAKHPKPFPLLPVPSVWPRLSRLFGR